MTILTDISNIIASDGLGPVTGTDANDTVDFSNVAENSTGGAFTGVIVDLDVNSAGANGTPSQDGAVLDAPPAVGGTQIDDRVLTDIENVIGSTFNDGLFGNNEVNIITAGAGNDLIHGFAGDDFQNGGEGVDTVLFSAAPNGVVVDLGAQVSDADFTAIVNGDQEASFAATGGAGSNVLAGFENVTASQNDDFVRGDEGANTLNGNGGNDFLGALGGNDSVLGGAGNDSIFASLGDDTLSGGDGNDQIFANVGADSISGGEGNDLLFGGDGSDTVEGGLGDDTLFGGTGDDTLTGGEGTDTFFFNLGTGNDVISDFENGIDFVNVEAFGFESIEALAAVGTQVGDDVVIQLDDNNSITILNITFDDILPEFFLI